VLMASFGRPERRWRKNREGATVVVRRHGCRRGEVFEGCETPTRGIAAEARRERARTAIRALWFTRELLGTARQSNVVNLESGIGLKDARGRRRAQAAEGARDPRSGAGDGQGCCIARSTGLATGACGATAAICVSSEGRQRTVSEFQGRHAT